MRHSRFITTIRSNITHERHDDKITIILLAENHGYRMKSYGPISLIDIGGKTLIEHQIEAISASFLNYEILLCSGYETHKIYQYLQERFKKYPIRIIENQLHNISNCCESLRLCMNNTMNDKIIICSGNMILTPEYLNTINTKKSSIHYQDHDSSIELEIGMITDGDRLENLSLAVKDKVWTELIYINNESHIKSLYNVISNADYKNKFLFEAINNWKSNKHLSVVKNSGKKIVKIGNIKSLKKVNYENIIS